MENQLPEITQADAVRYERNRLLKLSDWTQMPDSPLSAAKKAEWQTYRQALRDHNMSARMAFPKPPSK